MTRAGALRVGLVDDDPLVGRLLRDLFVRDGMEVCWVAASASRAMEHLRGPGPLPDVLVVDVMMPGEDGHRFTRRALAEVGPLTVVMLTSLDDTGSLSAALDAGAVGYLVKTDPPERILAALRAAAAGVRPFSTALPPPRGRVVADSPAPLSARELEVLKLVAASLTNDEIAERLFISPATVKRHVASILARTDTTDRLGAVMWAARRGLVDLG